jgi:hypothetical protein
MNIYFIKSKIMKRRSFISKVALGTAGAFMAPYLLPSGRLFASTGTRICNHVVYFLFAGGLRNQESVGKMYVSAQPGFNTSGNLMNNMLTGGGPTSNILYNPWNPILSNSLQMQGSLFQEMEYKEGPTGHFNGHSTAITGVYNNTGLNISINPEVPTIFEYYRKHTTPDKSAAKCWWISEGLGPYPSLNYSTHTLYGSSFGANFINPSTIFQSYGNTYLSNAKSYQPDDINRMNDIKNFLNRNFNKDPKDLPGINNNQVDTDLIKAFTANIIQKTQANNIEYPLPIGVSQAELSGDLINVAYSWEVLQNFQPELTVINTFNLDTCHNDFTGYLQYLHKADYAVGWLWNKIQSTPGLANDTILICMPEHGRNLMPNTLFDSNGLRAFDHTSDQNSRRMFGLIAGPTGKVKANSLFGSVNNPVGESIDMVPTIAHILGFHPDIPAGMLKGRVLQEAFF